MIRSRGYLQELFYDEDGRLSDSFGLMPNGPVVGLNVSVGQWYTVWRYGSLAWRYWNVGMGGMRHGGGGWCDELMRVMRVLNANRQSYRNHF